MSVEDRARSEEHWSTESPQMWSVSVESHDDRILSLRHGHESGIIAMGPHELSAPSADDLPEPLPDRGDRLHRSKNHVGFGEGRNDIRTPSPSHYTDVHGPTAQRSVLSPPRLLDVGQCREHFE